MLVDKEQQLYRLFLESCIYQDNILETTSETTLSYHS